MLGYLEVVTAMKKYGLNYMDVAVVRGVAKLASDIDKELTTHFTEMITLTYSGQRSHGIIINEYI